MNQSKHESIPFWECENNCWKVLISRAVSECNLWADSRDKLISQRLHSSLNSLWLTGQGTGGETLCASHKDGGVGAQCVIHAHSPLSYFAPQSLTVRKTCTNPQTDGTEKDCFTTTHYNSHVGAHKNSLKFLLLYFTIAIQGSLKRQPYVPRLLSY